MLSDEEVSENSGTIETIIHVSPGIGTTKQQIDYELNIKLKTMEETEKKMIQKFLDGIKNLKDQGIFSPIKYIEFEDLIIDLQNEFNEKWFK